MFNIKYIWCVISLKTDSSAEVKPYTSDDKATITTSFIYYSLDNSHHPLQGCLGIESCKKHILNIQLGNIVFIFINAVCYTFVC